MESENKTSFVRIAFMLLLVMVFFPLLPMIISGRWDWWQAWVMGALFLLSFIVSRAIAAKKTPDILKERANYATQGNTQAWDKWLSPVVAFGSVFILMAAGLDDRFDWSPDLSLGVELSGLALILIGYIFGSYAFVENAFFSGTVRLQPERGQTVVSTGPYAWVRHPGYLSSLIASLGMPLLLDSLWAFVPVLIFGFFFVLRTHFEDRFLRENLAGYSDYAKEVRYRLFPGIW
jgi:protein-S-isoprenylcysteine O-methyltransferase Ste14